MSDDIERRREERKKREAERKREEEELEKEREKRRHERERRRKGLTDPEISSVSSDSSTTSTASAETKRKENLEKKESKLFGIFSKQKDRTGSISDQTTRGSISVDSGPSPSTGPEKENPKEDDRSLRKSRTTLTNDPASKARMSISNTEGSEVDDPDRSLRKVKTGLTRNFIDRTESVPAIRRRDSNIALETLVFMMCFDLEEKQANFSSDNDEDLNNKIQKKWKLRKDEYELFDITPYDCLLLPVTTISIGLDDFPLEPHRINLKLKPLVLLSILGPIMGFPHGQYVFSTSRGTTHSHYLNPKKPLNDQGVYVDSVLYIVNDPTEAQKQAKKSQKTTELIFGSKKITEDLVPKAIISKLRNETPSRALLERTLRSAILSPTFTLQLIKNGIVTEIFSLLSKEFE